MKSLMKRKLLCSEEGKKEHPKLTTCDAFQPVLPPIASQSQLRLPWCRTCDMLTASSTQPRGHPLKGQLTQDILLHMSNLLLLP